MRLCLVELSNVRLSSINLDQVRFYVLSFA